MTEVEIILTHILKCKPADLLFKKAVLTPQQEQQMQEYCLRLKKGEPLQYIIGSWDFYGLTFNVNPSVLIPRPETEGLVELAVKKSGFKDILDLGTGSGNIAICMAKFMTEAKVVAVDISNDALDVAKENARTHGVQERVSFVNKDMGLFLNDCDRTFDLIISNPPYIPQDKIKSLPKNVQQEPHIALDGGSDGLAFYRKIIKYSPRLLNQGGYLMMEFGDGQAEAIAKLVGAQGSFAHIEIIKDLTGKERFIICH